jgi:8-oxo-dGTP diphosphatase
MAPSEDRLYPRRPFLAVSVAVFRAGRVLVARRAREPMMGRYSLPGGVVEIGESLAEAMARELQEEVGVEADIVSFNRHIEPIVRDEGNRVRAHFVIASFVARWRSGEPQLSGEVDALEWIDPTACVSLSTTPELSDVIAAAARIERSLP